MTFHSYAPRHTSARAHGSGRILAAPYRGRGMKIPERDSEDGDLAMQPTGQARYFYSKASLVSRWTVCVPGELLFHGRDSGERQVASSMTRTGRGPRVGGLAGMAGDSRARAVQAAAENARLEPSGIVNSWRDQLEISSCTFRLPTEKPEAAKHLTPPE